MDAVLNVRKPEGPTSHDVVDQVRRLFGQKRVGHAGTLDPMATGVLVVCLGKATRIVEYLMGGRKEYEARMVLGLSTDTQDSTGTIVAEADASGVTMAALTSAASHFVGEIEQVPPAISAIKHRGKPLYKLARQGLNVERTARPITVYSLDVLDFRPGEQAEADVRVVCGSGTYIRTLCSDIGNALGCGGHMSRLERTAVGRFRIEDAVALPVLATAAQNGTLEHCVTDLADALADMPAVVVPDDRLKALVNGLAQDASGLDAPEGTTVRMLSTGGDLLAVGAATVEDDRLLAKPRKVLVESK